MKSVTGFDVKPISALWQHLDGNVTVAPLNAIDLGGDFLNADEFLKHMHYHLSLPHTPIPGMKAIGPLPYNSMRIVGGTHVEWRIRFTTNSGQTIIFRSVDDYSNRLDSAGIIPLECVRESFIKMNDRYLQLREHEDAHPKFDVLSSDALYTGIADDALAPKRVPDPLSLVVRGAFPPADWWSGHLNVPFINSLRTAVGGIPGSYDQFLLCGLRGGLLKYVPLRVAQHLLPSDVYWKIVQSQERDVKLCVFALNPAHWRDAVKGLLKAHPGHRMQIQGPYESEALQANVGLSDGKRQCVIPFMYRDLLNDDQLYAFGYHVRGTDGIEELCTALEARPQDALATADHLDEFIDCAKSRLPQKTRTNRTRKGQTRG